MMNLFKSQDIMLTLFNTNFNDMFYVIFVKSDFLRIIYFIFFYLIYLFDYFILLIPCLFDYFNKHEFNKYRIQLNRHKNRNIKNNINQIIIQNSKLIEKKKKIKIKVNNKNNI